MILSGTQPWSGALLVAFIVFAAHTLGYVFWNESLEEKRAKLRPASTNIESRSVSTANLLEGSTLEPVASVTENTTAKLKTPVRK